MTSTRACSVIPSIAMCLLAPPLAWLAWISWREGKAGDAEHLAWFATVALGCVLAGALAPRAAGLLWPGLAAIASTLTTLFLWWSAVDDSGLFLVGLLIAAPLVVAASPLLLLIGRASVSRGRRRG